MNEADPRVKRTRRLLQDAFMALLAERSFQAISVQDIAERATLNRATFYAHFEDKYALMDYLVVDSFREALGRYLPPEASFSPRNLHLLVMAVCEFLAQFQGHCAPADRDLHPRFEARVQQEVRTVLLAWLRQAPVAPDAPATMRETAASVISWAIFGAGIEWARGERTTPADEWARQVLTVIVGGVSRVVTVPAQPATTRADARWP